MSNVTELPRFDPYAEADAEIEAMFRRQECQYPCVDEKADGAMDYWAVVDEQDPRAILRRGEELADQVCAMIRDASREADEYMLHCIVVGALDAAKDAAHPGTRTAGIFLREILDRAIMCPRPVRLHREPFDDAEQADFPW